MCKCKYEIMFITRERLSSACLLDINRIYLTNIYGVPNCLPSKDNTNISGCDECSYTASATLNCEIRIPGGQKKTSPGYKIVMKLQELEAQYAWLLCREYTIITAHGALGEGLSSTNEFLNSHSKLMCTSDVVIYKEDDHLPKEE